MKDKRKPGYYWVKMTIAWEIAEWNNNKSWSVIGSEDDWEDSDFIEINEDRIKYPDEGK